MLVYTHQQILLREIYPANYTYTHTPPKQHIYKVIHCNIVCKLKALEISGSLLVFGFFVL